MALTEVIEVVDQYGNPTGQQLSREECIAKGFLKRCSYIAFLCKNRGVLFQKRAQVKKVFPGVWDFTAAGHIDIAEDPMHAVLRETEEELGVKLEESQVAFQAMFIEKILLHNGGINNEIGYLHFADWTDRPTDFTLQEEEVESLEWFSLEDLHAKFSEPEGPSDFVPHKRILPCLLILAREFLRNNG